MRLVSTRLHRMRLRALPAKTTPCRLLEAQMHLYACAILAIPSRVGAVRHALLELTRKWSAAQSAFSVTLAPTRTLQRGQSHLSASSVYRFVFLLLSCTRITCAKCGLLLHWQNTTTLSEGSSRALDCICSPGYYNKSAQTDCTPCAAGSYKDKAGTGVCTLCPAGYYNPNTAADFAGACLPCPTGSNSSKGSTSDHDCICVAGYGLTDYCMPCKPGQYSTSNDQYCIDCVLNTYSIVVGATAASTCISCPANSTTLRSGSNQPTDCRCSLGYFGLSGEACTICQPGTYSDSAGPDPCTR